MATIVANYTELGSFPVVSFRMATIFITETHVWSAAIGRYQGRLLRVIGLNILGHAVVSVDGDQSQYS